MKPVTIAQEDYNTLVKVEPILQSSDSPNATLAHQVTSVIMLMEPLTQRNAHHTTIVKLELPIQLSAQMEPTPTVTWSILKVLTSALLVQLDTIVSTVSSTEARFAMLGTSATLEHHLQMP